LRFSLYDLFFGKAAVKCANAEISGKAASSNPRCVMVKSTCGFGAAKNAGFVGLT
jgi:hypothetical protein